MPRVLTAALLALAACTGSEETTDKTPSGEDLDGDGFTEAQGDCDDHDDAVFPGADERCNGIDDDCDGAPDDDALDAQTWYADDDGDGSGQGGGTRACTQPPGTAANADDCDDADADVNPAAEELPCTLVSESCGSAPDADLVVPTDHATLQEAVDAAADGAIVCVEAGTWAAVVIDHPVELRAYDGAAVTTIEGDGLAPAVTLDHADGTVLSGFTITGGAVGLSLVGSSDVVVEGCHVTGNSNSSFAAGGGLSASLSDRLVVEGCTFEDNDAFVGGGIGLDRSGDVTVSGCSLTDNTAASGGGLYAYESPGLSVIDSVFEVNHADYGGGIGIAGTSDGTRIEGCELLGHTVSGYGGAVWAGAITDLTLEADTLTANTARLGGGVYVEGATLVTSTSNTYRLNEATPDLGGGGLFSTGTERLVSHGDVFEDNRGGAWGGGMCAYEGGTIEVTDGRFEANQAGSGGGLAGVSLTEAQIDATTFQENEATSEGWGGGASLYQVDTSAVTGCSFEGNTSSFGGGGLAVFVSGTTELEANTLVDNEALVSGGGLLLYDDFLATVVDDALTGNTAARGGGINIVRTVTALAGGEVTGNVATSEGGGLYVLDADVELGQSNVHDNVPDDLVCSGTTTGCVLP